MPDVKQLLTLDEAARYLGVSKTSLRRWTNDGLLSCHRIGLRGERRFEQAMLEAFLAGRSASPPAAELRGHVGFFFRNPAEQWEGFRPYFLDHYRAAMPTIYWHNATSREQILEWVRDEGIDPEAAVASGLLRLLPAREAYLKQGAFSADYMIAFVRRAMTAMRAENFGRMLLTGEMDWYFSGEKGVGEIHAYEHRLNGLMQEYPGWTIVCQYDVTRFDAEAALQACCTHPVVHMRGRLWQGFYRDGG